MDELNIDITRSLFEVFVDLTEISESIFDFKKQIQQLLKSQNKFPDLNSIINKSSSYETFTEKSKNLDYEIKNLIKNFYTDFKKDIFSKYNIEGLEKFIKENFAYLFTLENFKILRKYPQNKIKKILYEDNSIYTGQVTKNNFNREIREGFGYFELFPSKDFYLGIFEKDNFSNGVFIKNSNNFYIGKFNPSDQKYYKFDGMTISLTINKLNICFGTIDIKNKISKGDFFLLEDDKIEYFSGGLINDEKSCEEGLLISTLIKKNNNNERNNNLDENYKDNFKYIHEDISDLTYTIIKGEFLNDIPIKNFEILKPEFHVLNIETEGSTNKPIKGFVEFSKINRGVYNGEAEFDDYSFFPSNKGNILYEKNTFYSGEFFSGKRSGKGIYLAYKNDNKYLITDGNFLDDNLNSGRIYNEYGKFNDDQKENKEGNSNNKIERYVFDGSFENNQFKVGTLLYDNGDRYVGEFLDNKRNGEGTYYYLNGSYYKGEWKFNMKHGKGKYFDKSNDMFVQGVWENNKIENLFHSKDQ